MRGRTRAPFAAAGLTAALAGVLALTLAGCGSGSGSGGAGGPGSVVAGTETTATASPGDNLTAAEKFRSVRTYVAPPAPTGLRIPSLGITTTYMEPLHRGKGGVLQSPTHWMETGWYADGPSPGQTGPAVILGHVDSKTGPAIFMHLKQIAIGAPVYVTLADHSRLEFDVYKVVEYPKARFPTEQVYLPTLNKELRLITCGGGFDAQTGHYLDNIVVFASLAGQ